MNGDEVTKDWQGNDLPDNYCPNCHVSLNASTEVEHDAERHRPAPGDVCICYHCGTILRLTELMILREIEDGEWQYLDEEQQQMVRTISSFVKENNPP